MSKKIISTEDDTIINYTHVHVEELTDKIRKKRTGLYGVHNAYEHREIDQPGL